MSGLKHLNLARNTWATPGKTYLGHLMPCCNIVQNSAGLEIGTPKFENLIRTKCTPGTSLTSLKPGSIHNQDFSKFSTEDSTAISTLTL